MGLSKHQYIRFGQLSFAILLGLLFFAIWEPENKQKPDVCLSGSGKEETNPFTPVQFKNGKYGIKFRSEYLAFESKMDTTWKKGTIYFSDTQMTKNQLISQWGLRFAEPLEDYQIVKE